LTPKKGLKTAAWFPPQERVTATSISQMLNNVGQGVSFLVASLMVVEPGEKFKSEEKELFTSLA